MTLVLILVISTAVVFSIFASFLCHFCDMSFVCHFCVIFMTSSNWGYSHCSSIFHLSVIFVTCHFTVILGSFLWHVIFVSFQCHSCDISSNFGYFHCSSIFHLSVILVTCHFDVIFVSFLGIDILMELEWPFPVNFYKEFSWNQFPIFSQLALDFGNLQFEQF